jgi:hypothetical protein
MLKKIDPQDRSFLAALLLIAALLILNAMGSFAENPQQPSTNYAQAKSNGTSPPKQPESVSFWRRTVREPINLFTGVLAVFTIILAGASIYQGVQTQKSVEIAQQALTDLERPYLFILDYNWLLIDEAKEAGVEYGWAYIVANGGNFLPLSSMSTAQLDLAARFLHPCMMSQQSMSC